MKLYFKYDSLYQPIFIFAQLIENEGKRNFNSPKASYVLDAIRSTSSVTFDPLFDFSRVFMTADIASVPERFLTFCSHVAINLNQINLSPNRKKTSPNTHSLSK